MRSACDGATRALARLLVRVFFRTIEIEGAERLPVGAPIVAVANHYNGLVDGLLLIATLPRYPRFLGKSTLFSIPPLWPFLKLAGVVPVYRAKDGGGTDRNAATFRTSRRLLRSGGMVAVFPEGISHDESTLQPLRTGAARIALGVACDDGVTGVMTVPIGLVYDAKARFRSRALVRVGEPANVDAFTARYEIDDHGAVRALTESLAGRLLAVSPSYPSWQRAAVLARIAGIAARSDELADQEAVAQALAASGASLDEVGGALDVYERDLALLGLTDRQLAESTSHGRYRRTVAWSLVKVAAALVPAVIGFAVHLVPYQIMKRVAMAPKNEGIKATVKLLGCFLLFTLTYGGLAVAALHYADGWTAVVFFAAAPACGYVTVRLTERVKRIGGLLAGYRVVRARGGVLGSVLEHRTAVVDLAHAALVGAA